MCSAPTWGAASQQPRGTLGLSQHPADLQWEPALLGCTAPPEKAFSVQTQQQYSANLAAFPPSSATGRRCARSEQIHMQQLPDVGWHLPRHLQVPLWAQTPQGHGWAPLPPSISPLCPSWGFQPTKSFKKALSQCRDRVFVQGTCRRASTWYKDSTRAELFSWTLKLTQAKSENSSSL